MNIRSQSQCKKDGHSRKSKQAQVALEVAWMTSQLYHNFLASRELHGAGDITIPNFYSQVYSTRVCGPHIDTLIFYSWLECPTLFYLMMPYKNILSPTSKQIVAPSQSWPWPELWLIFDRQSLSRNFRRESRMRSSSRLNLSERLHAAAS